MHGVDTILNVVGSVALLLWGVRMVRTGMTRAFGASLRRAIGACSRNRFTRFAGGLGLTGLLQIEHRDRAAARLLRRPRADRAADRARRHARRQCRHGARRPGALVRFSWLWAADDRRRRASPSCRPSRTKPRHLGRIAIGLGLMLLSLIADRPAAAPLRNVALLHRRCSPGMQDESVIAVLFGALATWLVHSSLSMVLLVMSFAGSGIDHPPLALALVLGANVGGALAPYMALSGGRPPAAACRSAT